MTHPDYEFTETERAAVVASLSALAVAQAEFWDVLRQIELEHEGVEIETDVYLVGELAAQCNVPPSQTDFLPDGVWCEFLEHASAIVRGKVQS